MAVSRARTENPGLVLLNVSACTSRSSDPQASSKIPLWFESSPFRGKRAVEKTAKPVKSFSAPLPSGRGNPHAPSPSAASVSRRMGRLWIETCLNVPAGYLECFAAESVRRPGFHVPARGFHTFVSPFFLCLLIRRVLGCTPSMAAAPSVPPIRPPCLRRTSSI